MHGEKNTLPCGYLTDPMRECVYVPPQVLLSLQDPRPQLNCIVDTGLLGQLRSTCGDEPLCIVFVLRPASSSLCLD